VAIKEWRVFCKAHTDKMQTEHRTLFGSNATTEIEYSGLVDARLPLMLDVEITPLLKGHTFPTNKILLNRRSQLLWLSDCHCLEQQLPGTHPGLCRILVPD
jgi:hypothetical protein